MTVLIKRDSVGHLIKGLSGIFILFSIWALNGCATGWQEAGSFPKIRQTSLTVESSPPGQVYVNNKLIGNSPIVTPIEYEQTIKIKARKVSYWKTQPGWSALLSIVSLGIYVPFSLIPVDAESSLEPTDRWRNNSFDVYVTAAGYKSWQDKVVCTGQGSIVLKPILTRSY